ALLLVGWTLLPGSPAVWTVAGLVALALPICVRLIETLGGTSREQSWSVFLRTAGEDLKTAVARAALQLTFAASQAYESLHAISVTLVRLGITHERLLECETT